MSFRAARCGDGGVSCFFFQAEDGIRDYKVTGVQTCALPIWTRLEGQPRGRRVRARVQRMRRGVPHSTDGEQRQRGKAGKYPAAASNTRRRPESDRKSTRLNSSHLVISYAVFCLKKKKIACHTLLIFASASKIACITDRDIIAVCRASCVRTAMCGARGR